MILSNRQTVGAECQPEYEGAVWNQLSTQQEWVSFMSLFLPGKESEPFFRGSQIGFFSPTYLTPGLGSQKRKVMNSS